MLVFAIIFVMINRFNLVASDTTPNTSAQMGDNVDFSDITPQIPTPPTTSPDVAQFFNLPYEPVQTGTRYTKEEREANKLDRRIIGVGIVVGLLASGATYMMARLDTSQEEYVDEVAECVSERVGYKVNLPIHPEDKHIMATAELVDDVKACEK